MVVTSSGPAESSTPSPRFVPSTRPTASGSRGRARAAAPADRGDAGRGGLVGGRRQPSSVGRPGRRPLLVERGEALARLGAHPLPGDDAGGVPLGRAVAQAADLADDGLRRARRGRAGRQHVAHRHVDRGVQRGLALDDLVDEADPLGPDGIEATTAREQRPGMRLADLGDDERGDDRRQDAQARLGEAELRAALGDDDVAHRAQAHPATERRAVDAGDDRHRAAVEVSNMSAMAIASCSLPSTSRAMAARIQAMSAPAQNDGPVAGQDDGPEVARAPRGRARRTRAQRGDGRRIEGVVDLGSVEGHPGDEPAGRCARRGRRPSTDAPDVRAAPRRSSSSISIQRVESWPARRPAGGRSPARLGPTAAPARRPSRGSAAARNGAGPAQRSIHGPAYTRSPLPDRRRSATVRHGPDDPWSPHWQPDDGRERFVRIRVARRGALLAAAV